MKAVILAGDNGSRLYPLTADTPKAMVKVFNKPVLEHTIELLKRHDVRDITIALAHKPEQILDYFGGGAKWGVTLQYLLQDTPMGTAGSLRLMQPVLEETFIVLTCDAVTDLDLREAIEYHRSRSALATVLTHETDGSFECAVVESTDDGRIRRLIPKPSTHGAASHNVSTGVYLLEPEILHYVPHGTLCDFGMDVFPRLIQNQEPFYACRPEGYWGGIGSLGQYRRAHFDALAGKVRLNLCASRISEGIWIGEDAHVHPTAKIRAPFYVGNGVRIGRNAELGRYAVVGDMSEVGENARIIHSILAPGSIVGAGAQVYGSIMESGTRLDDAKSLADEVLAKGRFDSELKAEVDPESISQPVADEHSFTWSGLEIAGLARDIAHVRHLAA